MEILNLRGWNVSVDRGTIIEKSEGNGEPKEGRELDPRLHRNNYVVRELTGGIVLSGGELPKI